MKAVRGKRLFSPARLVHLSGSESNPRFSRVRGLLAELSLAGLQEMHDQVAALGGQSMLMLTWGRRDGDVQNPVLYEDFSMMQSRLNEGYFPTRLRQVLLSIPFMWLQLDQCSRMCTIISTEFAGLYANDGSHPSQLGSKLRLWRCISLTGRVIDVSTLDYLSEMATWVVEAVHNTVLEVQLAFTRCRGCGPSFQKMDE